MHTSSSWNELFKTVFKPEYTLHKAHLQSSKVMGYNIWSGGSIYYNKKVLIFRFDKIFINRTEIKAPNFARL